MILIESITRDSKSVSIRTCALLGILLTTCSAFLLWYLMPINIGTYLTGDKIVEVLSLPIAMIFFLFIHECIHVLFFVAFGKGKAKIKVERDKKLGAIMIHQINEDVYYNRLQIVVTLLSPLVILSILLYVMMLYITLPFTLGLTLILNVMGSSIDFYLSLVLLFRYKEKIMVNFSSKEVKLNIYKHNSN